MKNIDNTISCLSFTNVLVYGLYYQRGKFPYCHDVLIFDTMLALKHFLYIQRIKLHLGFLWLNPLEEHLNTIHPFN